MDKLAEEGDEGPTDTRCSAKKRIRGGEVDISEDESDVEFSASGINHGDLFSKNKGGAQIAQGDDDFDEEMGGQSQVLEVATKIACEGIRSDIEDEDGGDEGDDDEEGDEVEDGNDAECIADVGAGDNASPQIDSPKTSPEQTEPDFSENGHHDCSPFSFDGLRTQPTPTSTQKEPSAKRGTVAKVTLLGTVFETSTAKDLQPATKQNSDLYIPTYSRRKD